MRMCAIKISLGHLNIFTPFFLSEIASVTTDHSYQVFTISGTPDPVINFSSKWNIGLMIIFLTKYTCAQLEPKGSTLRVLAF